MENQNYCEEATQRIADLSGLGKGNQFRFQFVLHCSANSKLQLSGSGLLWPQIKSPDSIYDISL